MFTVFQVYMKIPSNKNVQENSNVGLKYIIVNKWFDEFSEAFQHVNNTI